MSGFLPEFQIVSFAGQVLQRCRKWVRIYFYTIEIIHFHLLTVVWIVTFFRRGLLKLFSQVSRDLFVNSRRQAFTRSSHTKDPFAAEYNV